MEDLSCCRCDFEEFLLDVLVFLPPQWKLGTPSCCMNSRWSHTVLWRTKLPSLTAAFQAYRGWLFDTIELSFPPATTRCSWILIKCVNHCACVFVRESICVFSSGVRNRAKPLAFSFFGHDASRSWIYMKAFAPRWQEHEILISLICSLSPPPLFPSTLLLSSLLCSCHGSLWLVS